MDGSLELCPVDAEWGDDADRSRQSSKHENAFDVPVSEIQKKNYSFAITFITYEIKLTENKQQKVTVENTNYNNKQRITNVSKSPILTRNKNKLQLQINIFKPK